jgi:type I restriction enzyme S subunit
VEKDEEPFELPSGWEWARVNDTGFYINGLAFKPSDWKEAGQPIIRIQNLSDPSKPFNYAVGEFPDDVVVRRGDLLVSWSATLEAFIWDREDGVLNQHIFRVKPSEALVAKAFLYYLLRQAIRDMAASEHAHGLVMAHINRGPFLNHVVAIPPLAEQRRIVARVDELMGLLDRLEAARATRDAVRRAARDAALADLRDAPDAEAVEA